MPEARIEGPLARFRMRPTISLMFGCKHNQCGILRRITGGKPATAPPDLPQAAVDFSLSTGETLAEASESKTLVLVFLRHFGCTFTRQILRGLETLQESADTHGARLVIVHMLKSGDEIRYLGEHDDVARIADPNCHLYRAFGLGNGGLLELFGPRVWWQGAVSIFKGCGAGYLAGNALQMPGAFLFHHRQITAAQRAKSAAELPDLAGLFGDPPGPS